MNVPVFRTTPTLTILVCALTALLFSFTSVVLATNGPHVELPEGVALLQIGDEVLQENDLIPEPDHLGQYDKLTEFFSRQERLFQALQAPEVMVTFQDAAGKVHAQNLETRTRTIFDLPFAFWFQQAVGMIGLLTAGWVLALKPNDWGARMFSLTGLFLAMFASAASVYSTRQIALPGDLFRVLSSLNHTGAGLFGIGLVGLFLMYPRPFVRPVWLLVPAIVFSTGIALDVAYIPIGEILWVNIVVATQMLLAIVFGIVQWWRSRNDQVARAGLRWFFLFSLVGCSLFISLSVLPPEMGLAEEGFVPQAYAFGFFNLMHIGLALGVVRWRIFELDRYAYYIWLWLAGALLVLTVDFILLLWLRDQPWESLSIALVVGGFLYFPLRQLLMIWLMNGKTPKVSHLIPEVIDVALSPSKQLQRQRWDALLDQVFAPAAKIESHDDDSALPKILENGLALSLPPLQGIAGRQLRYAGAGRRLFNSEDVRAATTLSRMYAVASESHLAYERGIRVERDRISRDVHDNIGAQLLSALHAAETAHKDVLLRDTLSDLRQIINDGFRTEFKLGEVIADLRAEMADRLEVHSIALEWPTSITRASANSSDVSVPFLVVNTMRSILREITSNVIKHANANMVQVQLTQLEDRVSLNIYDDGVGFNPDTVSRGAGLDNMAERLKAVGGQIEFERDVSKTLSKIIMPLDGNIRSALAEAAQ